MKEPTKPFSLWIDDAIYYIDKDGVNKRLESYLAVKNSVYPHLGQEKDSRSLP